MSLKSFLLLLFQDRFINGTHHLILKILVILLLLLSAIISNLYDSLLSLSSQIFCNLNNSLRLLFELYQPLSLSLSLF